MALFDPLAIDILPFGVLETAQPKLRKKLSAPGLMQTVRRAFEKVPDRRSPGCPYSMPDALTSGLAILELKFLRCSAPSLGVRFLNDAGVSH